MSRDIIFNELDTLHTAMLYSRQIIICRVPTLYDYIIMAYTHIYVHICIYVYRTYNV